MKHITKKEAAKRLGIKEQQIMKHCKALKIKPGRALMKTASREQFGTVLTLEEFQKVKERHGEVGRGQD